ncbi:hypothetical protein KP806_12140 [Paenibacillus sp. N4]|uniref:hypothetical protein n=1 Tax=Paenibacillus vietnamensis TaxID=2590547 RepID=UPI001CD0D0AB|nr:hypothetical protein [Paenibacillus vietnamensis]MCA0755799.1 hypothetical protein [Paenibacillus vietnamensis]
MQTANFQVEFSENDTILKLVHPNDPYQMNWAGELGKWGQVKMKSGLDVSVNRQSTADGKLKETYVFTNRTEYDVYVRKDDIGVYATFPDQYDSADVCKTQRSHAHIWCGRESSYIMGLRMGGIAPHLGLVLTAGSIANYSIERDISHSSNHRGSMILHPAPFILPPGASYTLEWELFWHEGKDDFYAKLRDYPHYVHVEADKYVLFSGEKSRIAISHTMPSLDQVSLTREGKELPFTTAGNTLFVEDGYSLPGEYKYDIRLNSTETYCVVLVLPTLERLIKARCEFIVRNQQCHRPDSRLNGAYLIYDNEDGDMYYSHYHDHNGGRERFGMGVLIATYLRVFRPENAGELEHSLLKYVEYIERELFDAESGEVYNDIGRNNDIHRLYNYTWLAILYMELFNLFEEQSSLVKMSNIMHAFYKNGGGAKWGSDPKEQELHAFGGLYPIELPIRDMIRLLRENGLTIQADSLFSLFAKHAETIRKIGTSYPPSEVKYEQAIVAPAANILIQMYGLNGDEGELTAFREHLRLLELFSGGQPDYNLHEVAIRHWDGYWFGKRRLYGDTFPHYWSGLSGRVYAEYASVTGDERYARLAERSLRGVLSLFKEDGSASCARLFPLSINDVPGKFDDPWANDQDWALYFMLSSG